MSGMDLADFLLARIAEDEAAATDEAIARMRAGTVIGGDGVSDSSVDQAREGMRDLHRRQPWAHLHDPARVLAECEAKRRIVADVSAGYGPGSDVVPMTLALLALPYANHPDYREEWRP